MNSNFTKDEIVEFERYNKKLKRNVTVKFPVVGGRLRMFHEELSRIEQHGIAAGIDIEIVKYDEDLAVVKAKACIHGNAFTGVGMASKSRDSKIWPAILELAETRAIARALRFAGYGVEYTGAEEMQSVKNFGEDLDEKSLEVEEDRDVNDDMRPTQKDTEADEPAPAPSLKRQVWNLVTEKYPTVIEGDLAASMKKFVITSMAKYDDGKEDTVYDAILSHQERFFEAFDRVLVIPEIKSPGIVPDEVEVAPEVENSYNKLRDEVTAKMTVDAPPPLTPLTAADKVKKANIYREMPDGVNVSALNGTLKTLIEKNKDYTPGDIYDFVLEDIEGFMIILKEWCESNDVPTGLEPKVDNPIKVPEKKEKKPISVSVSPMAFRKSWVRLDWENFGKFIIENAEKFKTDKEEYDLAVAKFDRLKKKSGAPDMRFPYLFSHDEVVLSPKIKTDNSVIYEAELENMQRYQKLFPDLSKQIIDQTGVRDPEVFNDKIEEMLTEHERETGVAYTED